MDVMKLMKQAGKLKKAQKKIAKQVIEEEVDGAVLRISGDGKVKNFEISQELYDKGKKNIEKATLIAVKSCLKKQQDIQKNMAKEAMGGSGGLSSMLGG